MKIAEILNQLAMDLESEDNMALLAAEENSACLDIVAMALAEAAQKLREGAAACEEMSEEESLDEEGAESKDLATEIAGLSDILDQKGLGKEASVLDAILLTLASDPMSKEYAKLQSNKHLDEMKRKYEESKSTQQTLDKHSESVKAIEKSEAYKTKRPLQEPLSTRHCPDHGGTSLLRVEENLWQCPLDRKQYNFLSGFSKLNGDKVPGGDVANQSKEMYEVNYSVFDTRQSRLDGFKG